MKRKLLTAMICILGILYLQFGRTPDVNVARTAGTADSYILHLTVTANKLCIINKEQYAKSLVQRVLDNNFKNMIFSYDEIGIPKEIHITVYTSSLTKFHNHPAFEIHYITSEGGIQIILKEQSLLSDCSSHEDSY